MLNGYGDKNKDTIIYGSPIILMKPAHHEERILFSDQTTKVVRGVRVRVKDGDGLRPLTELQQILLPIF